MELSRGAVINFRGLKIEGQSLSRDTANVYLLCDSDYADEQECFRALVRHYIPISIVADPASGPLLMDADFSSVAIRSRGKCYAAYSIALVPSTGQIKRITHMPNAALKTPVIHEQDRVSFEFKNHVRVVVYLSPHPEFETIPVPRPEDRFRDVFGIVGTFSAPIKEHKRLKRRK